MRVQAKRLQRNGVLKVKHTVASSGKQQRALLIDGANTDGMKPVYCIYCSEPQRKIWKQGKALGLFRAFQTGCLLADASEVPLTTRRLHEIEHKCIPWHYLFERFLFAYPRRRFMVSEDFEFTRAVAIGNTLVPLGPGSDEPGPRGDTGWNAPTIADLNGDTGRDFDRVGVRDTTDEDLARVRPDTAAGRRMAEDDQARLHERGIYRMLVIDVRMEQDAEG